jgi:hypothetical protein
MDSESPVGVEQQEVKEVVLSPGQSLLLRCTSKNKAPKWFSKGRGPEITTQVKPSTSEKDTEEKCVCIGPDSDVQGV